MGRSEGPQRNATPPGPADHERGGAHARDHDPRGDPEDPTRTPAEFDAISERLTQAGISHLDLVAEPWGDPSAPSLL